MKPATTGLFAFVISLLVYTITAYLLDAATNSGFNTSALQVEIALAVTAVVITGFLAYTFEHGPPVTPSPAN